MRLILASSSPRRRDILRQVGLDFEVIVPDVDESGISGIPEETVRQLARLKAKAVFDMIHDSDSLILSADTVVSIDGLILNKPVDEQDAFRMLRLLSGREHEVCTGVCLVRSSASGVFCPRVESVKTSVSFLPVTEDQIWSYIRTGEPMDKAGAYGIQGRGALFVDRLNGDYYNVVGLPVSQVARMIEKEKNG